MHLQTHTDTGESPSKATSELTPEFVREDIKTRKQDKDSDFFSQFTQLFQSASEEDGIGHSSSFQLEGEEVNYLCVHYSQVPDHRSQ